MKTLLLCATLVLALAPTAISGKKCTSIKKAKKCDQKPTCEWTMKAEDANWKSCVDVADPATPTAQGVDAAKCAAYNKKSKKCKKQLGCKWTFKANANRKSCVSVAAASIAAPTSTPSNNTADLALYEWEELDGCCRVGRNDPLKDTQFFNDVNAVEAETMCAADCLKNTNCTAYEFTAKKANVRKGTRARNQCEVHQAKISSATRKNKSCRKAKCFVKGKAVCDPEYFYAIGNCPLTDNNFKQEIAKCLTSNPVDGQCGESDYGSIAFWDVSRVTNYRNTFQYNNQFNGNITGWDTSAGTTMESMFDLAFAFNQPINNWNTTSVTSMWYMFYATEAFNQELKDWDTGRVTDMSYMFYGTVGFDQDISDWDTGKVIGSNQMFWPYDPSPSRCSIDASSKIITCLK